MFIRRTILLLSQVVSLSAVAIAPALAQVSPNPIQDSTRFRGAEWEVVSIITLDSSRNADTTAIRNVGRVYFLGPGRVVFEGRLTKGGKWALFGAVGGVTRRLGEIDRDFVLPDGSKRRLECCRDGSVGGGLVGLSARAFGGLANFVMATDGESWRRVVGERDTLRIGDSPAILANAINLVSVGDDGSLVVSVSFKQPKAHGILRLGGDSAERLLFSGDSLPGVGLADTKTGAGVWAYDGTGVKQFIPTNDGWIASYSAKIAGKQQDLLIRRSGDAAPRVIWRMEIVGRSDGIGTMTALSGGSVIFQRDSIVGMVDTSGTWRPLLTRSDIAPPKDESFKLTGVTPLAGGSGDGALFSIHFSKYNVYSMGTSGIASSTTWSAWPKLFHFDGSGTRELRSDSAVTLTSLYTSLPPQPVARRLPGYDGFILEHQLGRSLKEPARYFDATLGRIVTLPAFRTPEGDIGLDRLIGWNSESEAVVVWNGLAMLRRR